MNGRKLLKATGLFVIVYLALLMPQSGAGRLYADFLSQIGNKLYRNFSEKGYVRLKVQDDKGKNDLELFISRRDWIENGQLVGASTDKASDRIGFLITAFFLALMAASPVTLKRKAAGLLLGFLLMTAFVMLKLYIIILDAYTRVPWFELFQESTQKARIQLWYNHFAAPATYGYSFALIVWLLMTLGRREWQTLNGLITHHQTKQQNTPAGRPDERKKNRKKKSGKSGVR